MADVVVVDKFHFFSLQFGAHLFALDERKALAMLMMVRIER